MEVNKVLVLGNENFLTLLKNTAHMHYVLSSTHNDALNKLREYRNHKEYGCLSNL